MLAFCSYSEITLWWGYLHRSPLSVLNKLSNSLTHWGRATHICVSKLIIIGSDNGLSPIRCQAIIWTNAGMLSTGTLGTNFSEKLSEIHTLSFKQNVFWKLVAILSRAQCVRHHNRFNAFEEYKKFTVLCIIILLTLWRMADANISSYGRGLGMSVVEPSSEKYSDVSSSPWGTSDIYSVAFVHTAGLILGLCPANERRRYKVMLSLNGWAQT